MCLLMVRTTTVRKLTRRVEAREGPLLKAQLLDHCVCNARRSAAFLVGSASIPTMVPRIHSQYMYIETSMPDLMISVHIKASSLIEDHCLCSKCSQEVIAENGRDRN